MADTISRFRVEGVELHNRKIKEASTLYQRLGASGRQAGQMLGQVDRAMGTNIASFGKLTIATAACTTAFNVLKDAIKHNEVAMDEWNAQMKSCESAYSVFVSSLNNQNWDNFFNKLNDAIAGGRELYNIFDNLGSMKTNNSALIATLENKMAELRIAKQQGKDVDAELKSVSARLAGIKSGQAVAGQQGNKKAFITELTQKGVPANLAESFWNKTLKEGQGAFNWARQERNNIARQQLDYQNSQGAFMGMFATLPRDSERQALDAILQSEGDLGQYITGYAAATAAATSMLTQQYKYNRWGKNTGGTGGKGGGGRTGGKGGGGRTGGKGGTSLSPLLSLSNISGISLGGDFRSESAIGADIKKWQDALKNATSKSMQDEAKTMIKKYEDELKITQHGGDPLSAALSDVTIKSDVAVPALADGGKAVKESWNDAANAIGAVGAAMQGIEDPTIRVVGIIGEAIATIALTFAKSLKGTVTPWDWIAAAASGTATMISTISAIKSATEYHAQGGIVGAQRLSRGTDTVPAMLTPGEIVLNKSQQMNLSRQLSLVGNSMGGSNSYVSGEQLVTVINNYGRRTGRGEILR